MSTINVEIKNIHEIKSAFRRSPKVMVANLNVAIKSSILFIARKSAMNAPVRTGNLRASHFRPESLEFKNLYGKLQPSPKYAAWVHDGTSPYMIEAINKKALYWDGAKHPTKRVFHPGIKSNKFLKMAAESSQNQVDKFFEKAVSDTLNKISQDTK